MFRPAYKNQVRPPTQEPRKSISTLKTSPDRPTFKNQVNCDPYMKTKWLSARTQEQDLFPPPAQKQVFLDPPKNNKVDFHATNEVESNRALLQNHVSFDAQIQIGIWFRSSYSNEVFSYPHTKTKSIPIPTRNQVKFDPPRWNQSDFDDPHKNEVNFDAHTKTERASARIPKQSQDWPPTQNQINRSQH